MKRHEIEEATKYFHPDVCRFVLYCLNCHVDLIPMMVHWAEQLKKEFSESFGGEQFLKQLTKWLESEIFALKEISKSHGGLRTIDCKIDELYRVLEKIKEINRDLCKTKELTEGCSDTMINELEEAIPVSSELPPSCDTQPQNCGLLPCKFIKTCQFKTQRIVHKNDKLKEPLWLLRRFKWLGQTKIVAINCKGEQTKDYESNFELLENKEKILKTTKEIIAELRNRALSLKDRADAKAANLYGNLVDITIVHNEAVSLSSEKFLSWLDELEPKV